LIKNYVSRCKQEEEISIQKKKGQILIY